MASTLAAYQIDLRAETRGLSRDLRRAGRLWRRHGRDLSRQLNRLAQTGARAAKALAVAYAAGVAASTRTLVEYEQSLHRITALVGTSAEEIEAFGPRLRQLGQQTGQGPTQLLNVLFEIQSAGVKGAASLEILENASRAAAIQLGDAATVAKVTTSAINTYGTEVLSVTRATDALAEAVRLGQLAPETLAPAIGRLLPVGQALNVTYGELLGLMAAFSRLGLNASESATVLGETMNAILIPSQKTRKAFMNLGLSIEDVQARVGQAGLLQTLIELRESVGGTNEGLVQLRLSATAMRGVFGLLGRSMETNRDIVRQMTDDLFVLPEAFDSVAGSARITLAGALSQIQFAMLEVAQAAAPELLRAAERITAVFSSLAGNATAIGAAIGTVTDLLIVTVARVYEWRDGIILAVAAWIAFRAAVTAGAVITALHGIGAALITGAKAAVGYAAALISTGGAVAIARAGLIGLTGVLGASVVALYAYDSEFREAVDGWGRSLSSFFRAIAEAFGAGLGVLISGVLELVRWTGEALNLLPGVAIDLDFITRSADATAQAAYQLSQQSNQSFVDAWDAGADAVEKTGVALDGVPRRVKAAFGELVDFASEVQDLAADFIADPSGAIADALKNAVDRLRTSTNEVLAEANEQAISAAVAPRPRALPESALSEDAAEVPRREADRFGETLGQQLARASTDSLLRADFQGVGESLVFVLSDRLSRAVSNLLGGALDNLLGGLLGGGGGIGSILGFQSGGIVPGTGPRPAIVHGGEVILNPGQQRALLNGGVGNREPINIEINVTGDVDAATRRAVRGMAREVSAIVQSDFDRRGVLA